MEGLITGDGLCSIQGVSHSLVPLGCGRTGCQDCSAQGRARPLFPLKQEELTKMGRGKEDHHIAAHSTVLSHAETHRKYSEALSPS